MSESRLTYQEIKQGAETLWEDLKNMKQGWMVFAAVGLPASKGLQTFLKIAVFHLGVFKKRSVSFNSWNCFNV